MARREHPTEAFASGDSGDRYEPDDIEPYETRETYESGAEDYDPYGAALPGYGRPRVLWGRIALLAACVLGAFLIGRSTAGSGVDEEKYEAAVASRNAAQEQVKTLESQVTEAEQRAEEAEQQLQDLEAPDAGETTDPTAGTTEEETYVVEPGDTFRTIALEFYGDATLDDVIMEANGITDPLALQSGQEIIIPPEP